MAISVAEYRSEHEPMVRAFNQRLSEAGSHWGFYDTSIPAWLPPGLSPKVRRDFYLATDETPAVRGAYCLKRQPFLVNGNALEVASIQGPVSEGLVDQRFGTVALHLIRDMQGREPKLFAWGASERLLSVLRRMRWTALDTPFAMKVVRGNRFLRLNRFLRGSRTVRLASDLLAASHLGTLAFGAAQFGQRILAGGLGGPRANAVEASRFGPWADEIWSKVRSNYDFIAARDSQTMNLLLPQDGWPEASILKMEVGGSIVGWAAVRNTQLKDSPRFGDLRIGSVIDALSLPGCEHAVLMSATRYLERRGVDAIVANFSNPVWNSAFKRCGFLVSDNRRILLISPALAEILGGDQASAKRMHLTPLDGDGPLGL
ncbi:hypothetical protein [Phenylobacterium koreense]|uniref:N-acetyltransferase domain-containing protein n=1 Tax=Phenylobacterium koreense TaxID=266125 RepID=A0ABV2EM73_9CAUL